MPCQTSAASRPAPPPEGWWEQAFTLVPSPSEQRGHPCGHKQMLTIIAYDITEPRRLAKLARHCENYGVRVQYSVFECRLEADSFTTFWLELEELIDPKTDRLVAYRVCHACAKEILTAGTMLPSSSPIAYVF
ncbi:MAG: CRISPR-associated endonuclease Cas2 [Terrimicrobiaceae bacterium]|nr:CRISPR-associated endonuclease Cas2 [Terrimicrobiaceae bacterium]